MALCRISIHALLTESDHNRAYPGSRPGDFNPRSPHGERPGCSFFPHPGQQFQSTLSSRRATGVSCDSSRTSSHFNPRSPHGERLNDQRRLPLRGHISIHALLTESDKQRRRRKIVHFNFNPRSPHGERRFESRRGQRADA